MMKSKIMHILTILGMLTLAVSTTALATPIGVVFGDNKINDDKDSVFSLLSSEGVPQEYLDLTFLGKIGEEGTELASDEWGNFTITNWGNSGDWNSTWAGVDYVSVKGGTSFAVYSVDHFGSGSWTTDALTNKGGQQPNLSHISFWSAKAKPTSPGGSAQVPEPATIFLLGSGLLGLFGYRKKFWKPKN
jgi:hypothetical protein